MEEKQQPDEQSGNAKATSVIKQHALPLSVIVVSTLQRKEIYAAFLRRPAYRLCAGMFAGV